MRWRQGGKGREREGGGGGGEGREAGRQAYRNRVGIYEIATREEEKAKDEEEEIVFSCRTTTLAIACIIALIFGIVVWSI